VFGGWLSDIDARDILLDIDSRERPREIPEGVSEVALSSEFVCRSWGEVVCVTFSMIFSVEFANSVVAV